MCAGVAGTQALKILLNRGKVPVAPRGIHYDAFKNKLSHTWRPWGNNNPIQRLGLMIARKRVSGKAASQDASIAAEKPDSAVYRILERARWAPSGDNEQPWRFEVVDDLHIVIHTNDTRDWCVYDLDGSSSQIAVGALLETIAIAASGEGLVANFTRRPGTSDEALLIDVRSSPNTEHSRRHTRLPVMTQLGDRAKDDGGLDRPATVGLQGRSVLCSAIRRRLVVIAGKGSNRDKQNQGRNCRCDRYTRREWLGRA